MPISVFWDDEQHTTLQMNFQGQWNDVEFTHATADIRDLLDASAREVDIIINMQHAGLPQTTFLTHFKQVAEAGPVRRIVLCGGGRLGEIMVQSVQRIYGGNGGSATGTSEGLQHLTTACTLDNARQTLSDLRAQAE